jgi:haloalkane dehalogenase
MWLMIPDWIDRNEFPFTPQQFKLPMGQLSYLDEGQGAPLVMVHGNPTWSFQFRHLIKHFSKSQRCLAPDHIGFGLSDKPADWNYLPSSQAENFERLLEALDLKNITLVVGDWGGPIGLSYAIRHPEKIKNIVVTNTWLWSVKADWYYRAFSGFMGGPIGHWLILRHNFFARSVVKVAYGDKRKLTPAIHRHYTTPLGQPAERKGSWVFPREIIGSSQWLESLWAQREALNDKIKLLAWGMKDIAFREKELNYWAKHFPAARVVRYADAGHYLSEEKPAELIRELNTLLVD